MLDVNKIRELVEMMVANDLVEVSLRDGDEEVNLRRPNAFSAGTTSQLPGQMVPANPGPVSSPPTEPAPVGETSQPAEDVELDSIASPMVGTFYASPSPDTPPFVRAGQQVHVGMVVCIVEAMKVFNEIKSEVAGTLERILVKNAQAIEFGQPLFLVRPQ